ncbi:MAG: YceI family protein [Ignavibacteria bacterium]|nr:MAG: YceI family protein [Ignavibacteria bacterium]
MNKRDICFIQILLLVAAESFAQTAIPIQMQVQPESKLRLDGNSTMHEYSAAASVVSGTILVDSAFFSPVIVSPSRLFRRVDLTIPVKQMHSGNEKLDDKMYDALQADDHPDITFRLTGDTIVPGAPNDSLIVKASGILAVAGKEKPVELSVILVRNQDSTVSIKGSKELLMTDFGIEPPSMMLGLLKTDDKVVIHFDIRLRSQEIIK